MSAKVTTKLLLIYKSYQCEVRAETDISATSVVGAGEQSYTVSTKQVTVQKGECCVVQLLCWLIQLGNKQKVSFFANLFTYPTYIIPEVQLRTIKYKTNEAEIDQVTSVQGFSIGTRVGWYLYLN